jgi:hypothetical protein
MTRLLAAALVLAAASAGCSSRPPGAPDPTVYPGTLSNAMNCQQLTRTQRQFINIQRYGCGDIPTPADAE